uniref:Uncharacterized protein n=1 Tax=Anguilla anguilla TaxID=7936 RepID=A0A0E9S5J8_ANGAN
MYICILCVSYIPVFCLHVNLFNLMQNKSCAQFTMYVKKICFSWEF